MKKGIIKTFSTVLIITLLAKALGLLRDIVFAKYYGTGYIATAFFASIRIPTQLLDIGLSAAITSTFIPIFNKIIQKEGKDEANKFANNFINIIAVITTLISVIGIIFAPQVVKLLAGGFDEKTYTLTVQLIKITFPMIIFAGIAFSFVGFLQSYGQFNIPAMISGISNFIIIIFLVVFRERFGIHGVAICMLIAWGLQVLVQLPSAYKNGYRLKPQIYLKDENIKKVFILALPIIISTSVLPINNLVATRIASGLEESAVAALEYSYKLYLVIVGIFTYAIGNIIFPRLSILSDDKDKFIELIQKAIRVISYLLIPLTLGLVIFRLDIVSILYQRGEFNDNSTFITSSALLYYSIGMIGFGLVEIMNKTFYSKQNVKTPMVVGIIVVVINIILSIILSRILGFKGLALATSITTIVNSLILIICANKDNKGIINNELFVTFLKIIISAIIMFTLTYFINSRLVLIMPQTTIYKLMRIVIGTLIGLVTYYIFTILFKIEEAYVPILYLKKKIKRTNN